MLHYQFNWAIIATEPYASLLMQGVGYTLLVALASALLSVIGGSLLAFLRVGPNVFVRHVANVYVEIIRNTPGLFWILFFYFVFPELLPQEWGDALGQWDHYVLVAGIMGLTVDNSAYLSDILRSGMLAVAPGQREAACSSGFSSWQECYLVICPLSLRSVGPAITNRMVHNFKNTSLCMAISLPELTWATQQIESITFRGLEVTAVATVFYIAGSLSVSALLARLFRPKCGVQAQAGQEREMTHAY